MDSTAIAQMIPDWKRQNNKVVLATGVFDLLHIEHLNFLKKAKQAGDKLVVGVETDARVKAIKGPNRPVDSQSMRLSQLKTLKFVDLVFLLPNKFDTQADWEKLMADLKPDIYAVSSHTSYLKNKRIICDKYGVTLKIVHQHNPAVSTTILLKT